MAMFDKIKKKIDFVYKLSDLFDRREKLQFSAVMVVALLMALFQAVGVASILPFVNVVMDPGIIAENKWLDYFFNAFHFESTNSFIVFLGFVVLGFLVIGNFVSAFATWLKIRFVWQKNHKLSNDLLKKYVFMPYSYFIIHNTANLSKNVLSEVYQLIGGYALSLINIITDSVITVIILILLLYVNPFMTLVAVAVLISFYLFIYLYFSENLKRGGQSRLKANKERYKLAGEILGGIKDIKVLGVEKFFLDRYSKHSAIFSNIQLWNQIVGQIPRYVMEVFAFGGVVGLLIFSISSNLSTQKIIPLVSFFAFAGYRLMPALQEIFNSLALIRFNKAVLDKIHADMVEESQITRNIPFERKNIKPLEFKEKIELKNIHFFYPNSKREILKGINIEIKKNAFVALIGATGSGKTTIVDLTLGLLTPFEGNIRVDGIEIGEDNIKNWRANLGYVPQQIYLSDNTVARNIAFGLSGEEIDMEKVKKAARMANIHEFIESKLPEGYDTFVGERGIRLSGGQRQRIGIARALYHDPQVLIFDEATSSLDSATEKEVLDAIEGMAKLKTMIVIAHRLTTVKNCDKVYVIDKGRITDEGSYDDIIGKKQKAAEDNFMADGIQG